MKFSFTATTPIALALSLAASLAAQAPPLAPPSPDQDTFFMNAPADGPMPPPNGQKAVFFSRGFSVDGKPVTGAPYSATSTTTMTQTLANGTRIVQTQQSSLARDTAGRTRREDTLQNIGPWSATQAPKSIVFINDPVAHVQYVMEQDSQTALRTSTSGDAASAVSKKLNAERASRQIVVLNSGASTPGITKDQLDDLAVTAGGSADSQKVAGEVKAVRSLSLGIPPPMIAGGNVVAYQMIGSDKDAKTENLPDQVIEGLPVHGTRITSTIPAGAMGNDQPIVTTTETWYSPYLQMVVLSKRSDPRIGDTVTALTGVSRSEPAASLFQVPAGYTVKDSDQPAEVHFAVHP